jgi:hypothetical protein
MECSHKPMHLRAKAMKDRRADWTATRKHHEFAAYAIANRPTQDVMSREERALSASFGLGALPSWLLSARQVEGALRTATPQPPTKAVLQQSTSEQGAHRRAQVGGCDL